ncbi:MAG: glutamine-hydrolyzing carbamoyl-phosphate synthase small subunit [Epulopiscium sp.]|nr:glutamine-hydrolyzing carbamoyl-phosphate synthase small subunit [Candidatus Epulonipiscium sp.]HOQ15740.1 carbamoyl phosphate synthase small subunit [Defluviitaleaceae bacterium]
MRAKLILEDGTTFNGNAFGYMKEAVGEVVFNTQMTGYQELLTDPSYYGQIVAMTYPLIGNYGINLEDIESETVKVKGLIVREKADFPNNWRCEMELDGYLKQNKVIGIEGIDTRALTKILSKKGTMRGIITVRDLTASQIEQKIRSYHNINAVLEVTTKEKYVIEAKGHHIAIIDFGVKQSIIECLKERNCAMTVFPAGTTPEEILESNPHGILLSNGPGNPCDISWAVENIKKLIGKKPILALDLGCQLLALALGGTVKKHGHRGANHPVKDLGTNKILITTQNHSYGIEELPGDTIKTHVNINDDTIEGFVHKDLPLFGVQFYPGNRDIGNIYSCFIRAMEGESVCQGI